MSRGIGAFRVKGGDIVIRKLDAIAKESEKALFAAMMEAGKLIAKDAKAMAPARPNGGGYRRRIRAKLFRQAREVRIASFKGYRASPLGHLLEFGHRAKDGTFVSARAHLFPAFVKNKAEVAKRLKQWAGGLR